MIVRDGLIDDDVTREMASWGAAAIRELTGSYDEYSLAVAVYRTMQRYARSEMAVKGDLPVVQEEMRRPAALPPYPAEPKEMPVEVSDEMASIGATIVHEASIFGGDDFGVATQVYAEMTRQAVREYKIILPDPSSLDADTRVGEADSLRVGLR